MPVCYSKKIRPDAYYRGHAKKMVIPLGIFMFFASCKESTKGKSAGEEPVNVSINLNEIKEDKIRVAMNPGRFEQDTVKFYLPKIVQGTYEISDFGKYIDSFKAIDYNGKELITRRPDENTWLISGADQLDKVTYFVNDTYDIEDSETDTPGFPSGTNIEPGFFLLNLHGFIGYFDHLTEIPYHLEVTASSDLQSTTPLKKTGSVVNSDKGIVTDTYMAARYFEIIDNPVIYGLLDTEEFTVNDIKIVLSVYSPGKIHKAASLKETVRKMISAQKSYLGSLRTVNRYDIYLCLLNKKTSSLRKYGALEHHTSTLAVFPESTTQEELATEVTDIVSHEFFHTITPLNIHSEKIHFFNYNTPAFSEHLWFYEGVTEYFTNHFQVSQKLISPGDYFDRIKRQLNVSGKFNDSLSFTELSAHILEEPYSTNFINLYFKGPLIAMCIDILIREESNGTRNMLSLTKELSEKYGKDNYFKDDQFIREVTAMTYPSVGDFLNTHVSGGQPIDYRFYLNKAGLEIEKKGAEIIRLVKSKKATAKQLALLDNWLTK